MTVAVNESDTRRYGTDIRSIEHPNWRGPQRRLGLVDRGHVGQAENSSIQDPELMHTGRSWADLK